MGHDSAPQETLGQAAERYVRRGWAIIPLHHVLPDGRCSCTLNPSTRPHKPEQGGKHPDWGKDWQQRGITSRIEAGDVWRERPHANIGILTGPASGFWVLDIDPKNGGITSLDDLEREHGALPLTYTVRTGSGGVHLYFAMPQDFVPGGSPGRLPAGIDVRGLGGQVVAPPSVSAVGPYSMYSDRPIVEAPEWLLSYIRPMPEMPAPTPTEVHGSAPSVAPLVSSIPIDAERGQRYALSAIAVELENIRQAPVGRRGLTAYAAACAILELLNSPWAGLDGWKDKLRWDYDLACAAAMAAGGMFNLDESAESWRSARRKVGERGRPEPADLNPGTGGALLGWEDIPRPFEPAPSTTVEVSPFDREVAVEAHKLRVRAAARDTVEAEQHAAGWTPPASVGSLTDELLMPDPVMQWRIKGALALGHNAMVVARRKAGKTTLINDLVRCLADGGKFLNRFDVERVDGSIAIFNYEIEAAQYRRWLRDVGVVDTDRVHVLHLRGSSLPLIHPRVRAWVTRWLRERDVKVWIPDPYSRAAIGSVGNSNDEVEVGRFLDLLDQVKADAGVSELIMPIHMGKTRAEAGEESAVGSHRLEGWPDSMWYLTSDVDSGQRFMRMEGRDVAVAEEELKYDPTTRRLTMGGWDRREAKRRREADIIFRAIQGEPGISLNKLANVVKMDKRNVKAVAEGLEAARKIYTEVGPNRSVLHHIEPGAKPYASDKDASYGE